MIQWIECYEEVCIYRKGWQVQNFGQKQQSELIHLMCESIQTAKWQARWTMKIDTHQIHFESIQISPDEDWNDSNSYESIQSKSENFMIRFTKIWIDSGKEEVKNWCCQHLNRFTCESIQENCEAIHCDTIKKTVNRFTAILFSKIWLNSKGVTQGEWTKGMFDMKLKSSNSRKNYPYMTTHKISRNHMTQWDMVC